MNNVFLKITARASERFRDHDVAFFYDGDGWFGAAGNESGGVVMLGECRGIVETKTKATIELAAEELLELLNKRTT